MSNISQDTASLHDIRETIRFAVLRAIDESTSRLDKPRIDDAELPALFKTLDAISERVFLKAAKS